MGHSTIITRGKELAFLLRHDKEYKFDKHGWREVSDLIKNHHYTMDAVSYTHLDVYKRQVFIT